MKKSNQFLLKMAMLEYNLHVEDIAEILMVKERTVRTYLYNQDSVNFRNLTDKNLSILKSELKDRKKEN